MSSLRSTATAWCATVTALAAFVLGASFLYLHSDIYTDADYVEINIREIASKRGFQLEEARRARYSDGEIAAHLSKQDSKSFERNWMRVSIMTGIVYGLVMFGLIATLLVREALSSTVRLDGSAQKLRARMNDEAKPTKKSPGPLYSWRFWLLMILAGLIGKFLGLLGGVIFIALWWLAVWLWKKKA